MRRRVSAPFSEMWHKVSYETRDSSSWLYLGFGITFTIPFQVTKVSKFVLTGFYFPVFFYNNKYNIHICLLHSGDLQGLYQQQILKGFHFLLGNSNSFSRALGTETVKMEKLPFFIISTS